MGLLLVAMPAQAQTSDVRAIIERMQAIIADMQALQAEFESLQTELSGATVASTPAPNGEAPSGSVLGAATSVLQEEAVYGNTNDTITRIQTLLATDPLIYADGTVSGFFGPKTQEAIRNLQARFGLDPVGVVGPATSELLMEFFVAYPGGSYPDDVLQSRPTARVLGAMATATSEPDQAPAPVASTPARTDVSTPIREIHLTRDDGETVIRVVMKEGGGIGLAIESKDEDDIVEAIAEKVRVTEAQVRAVLDMSDIVRSRSDSDYDDDDVDDAIRKAKDAIHDAEDAIDDADADGEDTDEAEELLEEAEEKLDDARDDLDDRDYDDAYENAREAEDLAEEAEEEARGGSSSSRSDARRAMAAAQDAIDEADEEIDDADDDGEDTDEAEELLEEAEDKLDDARDAYEEGDYDEAVEDAEEAEELAKDAEDEV
jgi:peptidoglycan hydrolase-like protein with peptidoglycan-binding domain